MDIEFKGFIDNEVLISGNSIALSFPKNPFKSFWMAGYECTDQINAFGNRVDFLKITSHLSKIDDDYKDLNLLKIKTVREGIRWSIVEKVPYQYDFSMVREMILAGKRNNIQQLWDICHFGFPDDLTPLHPMFARRFAAVCRAFVKFYREIDSDSDLIITPINEVSFLSWLGGDVRGTSPFCLGQGWEVKYHLMKAYIEAIEAMKAEDSTIRIMTTEPLVNITHGEFATQEEIENALTLHDAQFQVTDILSGRMCPELRGKPEYLDILGYNFYYNNQWILETHEYLEWKKECNDERFVLLHKLLNRAYQRYHRPFVITETSHPREHRPLWTEMIIEQCALTLKTGLPLWGVCWYPIIDRPDWDNLTDWHQSGIWDEQIVPNHLPIRNLHFPTAQMLMNGQRYLEEVFGVK
jgi:beta-glucosidase/6-phospho-beta-glucosidase/beta-galactosidase